MSSQHASTCLCLCESWHGVSPYTERFALFTYHFPLIKSSVFGCNSHKVWNVGQQFYATDGIVFRLNTKRKRNHVSSLHVLLASIQQSPSKPFLGSPKTAAKETRHLWDQQHQTITSKTFWKILSYCKVQVQAGLGFVRSQSFSSLQLLLAGKSKSQSLSRWGLGAINDGLKERICLAVKLSKFWDVLLDSNHVETGWIVETPFRNQRHQLRLNNLRESSQLI